MSETQEVHAVPVDTDLGITTYIRRGETERFAVVTVASSCGSARTEVIRHGTNEYDSVVAEKIAESRDDAFPIMVHIDMVNQIAATGFYDPGEDESS